MIPPHFYAIIYSLLLNLFPLFYTIPSLRVHVFFYWILALLKSISGCCSWNFLRISIFFCSSDVGKPCSFCRWSNIIFSTMPLVSPSRSESFELSGWILVTSMVGALVTTCCHHSILLILSRWISTILVPSELVDRVQVESSTRIAWGRSPY